MPNKPYHHIIDLTTEVEGASEDGSDITPNQVRTALLERLASIPDDELIKTVYGYTEKERPEQKLKEGFIATIQILIPAEEVGSEGEACDWIHALMDGSKALDWGYIADLPPKIYEYKEPYEEGDMFNKSRFHR